MESKYRRTLLKSTIKLYVISKKNSNPKPMKLQFKNFLALLLLIFSVSANAQYYEEHHIAPAPWQYWSDANEIVIGTLSATPVQVTLSKSDGTLITDQLFVTVDNPISYRFPGSPNGLTRNAPGETHTDRGLIVEATAPVLINLRNIASDAPGANSYLTIKGNASLVSFGEEGKGLEFRIGYYRTSTMGLSNPGPVYSVMATEDDTEVNIPTTPPTVLTLAQGESRMFHAPIGALLTANKPVVMNTGSWGDTPYNHPSFPTNGEDGTFDQIAPVRVLGSQYLVVRGWGWPVTANHILNGYGGEQTTVVASQDNTTVEIVNYNADGTISVANPAETVILSLAGDHHTFFHGDRQNALSSSLIETDKPVIVYSGTEVQSETDISTVLPIGGCAGTLNIQARKFIHYNNTNLPYSAFCVIESPDEPVMVNGIDIETYPGVSPRTAIGTTGFYLITFTDNNISSPDVLIITAEMPLTTSIVQSGVGFSMSAFFSAFGQASPSPVIVETNEDCTVTLTIEDTEGIFEYEWFLNGESLGVTEENEWVATESGAYSVNVFRTCGWGIISDEIDVTVDPCSDLSITKELLNQQYDEAIFLITVTNNDEIFTESNAEVIDVLPTGYTFVSATASQGSYDPVLGIWDIGELAPGQSETLEITVKINEQGEYVNVATVQGDNEDKNPDNNIDDATITKGKLIFLKNALQEAVYRVGEVIEYEISIKNDGPLPVVEIQIIDDNADAGSIVPDFIPRIEPGETANISARHTVTHSDFVMGEVINQATLETPTVLDQESLISDDPKTTALYDPTIVPVVRTADLHAVKDDGIVYYEPGQETTYVITVTNNGPSDAIDIVVSDPLPEGAEYMSWYSTIDTSGEGDLYDVIPVLAVGETVTYYVTVKINRNQLGDFINIVSVESEYNEDPVPHCDTCIDIDRQKVIIPKGISPNGDGLNDKLDLTPFHVAKITIFNRYGTEVYSKNLYTDEWEGQSNSGELLPSATYYYQIFIIGGFEHTGYIQLMRESR